MSKEENYLHPNQPDNKPRNGFLDKPSTEKKKKTLGWDRIRENVSDMTSEATPQDTSTISPASSSRSITPKPTQPAKKQHLNPFLRNQASSTSDLDHRPTLANTTLVAAQAAGMTHFAKNFRSTGHGAIYATSTAVQQDIYRLERVLDKLLIQARPTTNAFSDSISTFESVAPPSLPTHSVGRKSMFHKQTDVSNKSSSISSVEHDSQKDASKISHVISCIMEAIIKHKVATRLPMMDEILAILAIPFHRSPISESDCQQALDAFEYIKDRFKQLDAFERLEQILFCCRLLRSKNTKLKKRLIHTLDTLFEPCKDTPNYLPSTPTAYHSIIYTLILAYDQHDLETDIRSSILDIMDNLAEGTLIPIQGKEWKSYHHLLAQKIPPAVARMCVVESILKCLMVGICNQTDPYHGKADTSSANSHERTRDKLVLQDLLPRYWREPEADVQPAYLKIVFLLSELACETFLMSTVQDFKNTTSSISLLLPLIVEQLSPTKIKKCLADDTPRMVTMNIVVMLLYSMSLCSLEEQSNSVLSSPNLSPRPSIQDLNSDISPIHFESSVKSINLSTGNEINVRKMLMTLKGYMEELWNTGYKDFILVAIESMHQDSTGERTACCFRNMAFNINASMGDEIVKKTLPCLFKRLVDTYPPAIPALNQLLFELSKKYKSYFFKHVVSCVASDDEDKVTNMLNLMTCLRRYMSGVQFWMQDAEMINVLLLSDVGVSKKQREAQMESTGSTTTPQLKINNTPDAQWGSTTLGQCVIATEFMWAIQDLRDKQSDSHRNMEEDEIAKKFLIDLERRLAVFLTAKEKLTCLPMPLRVILCNIFADIRFFCNTTHRPGWLTRAIDWATQPIESTAEHVYHCTLPIIGANEPSLPTESKMPLLHTGHLSISSIMFERIHSVYLNVVELLQYETNDENNYSNIANGPQPTETRNADIPRHKRQQSIQTMFPITRSAAIALDLNPPLAVGEDDETANEGPALKLAKFRFENMEKIIQDPFGCVFALLAAVFTTLSSTEYNRLVRPLWERHLDDRKPESFIPASFLLMQCGEKIPKTMIEVCTHDFYSADPLRRLAVIQKHASLNAFRFNALGQDYIQISSRRRPFRGDGGAFSTPFVPTDLGSNQFTLDEPKWMSKLKNASNFPIELKRQIQELGWDDDDNGDEHEALKKVLTPIALLPSLFLEEEEERMNEDDGPTAVKQNSKTINISKIINKRKRATTVHSFTISFLSMVDLLNDDFGGASNALRELLEYFLRDDPSLFLRSFLTDLGKFKMDRHKDMFTRLRFMVSMQHKLPPGFSHILFNYLAGMLKWLTRENKKEGLVMMTLIHPILAELALSTNDLSIRQLRKNKIEHLLVSTGRFWFTHEQPSDMFPRYLSSDRTPFTILDIPADIFSVAMLRISHIQFLTNYLVRYPREVYAVKKTLQDYEPTPIPGNKRDSRWNMEEIYFPDLSRRKRRDTASYIYEKYTHEEDIKANRQPSQQQLDTQVLAALRARIWLRFIDNLLNGLNKNYNDRDELERILQGINAIITEHDNDFGIIGQALILYTRVVTRFNRLFISNRGYTTFLPALFKVFCQVDCFPQVRSAITFAWCRFYAIHEETFVFQMLGTLAPSILSAYSKSYDLGSWMVDNLFILMQAMHDPPHLGATSDVLGLQLQVELDDHERSIQERIDAASNPMAIPLSTTILKPLARSVTAPIAPLDFNSYNNRSFELQNFIKLFLTIIAYDPGSLRAEQFVKLFRYMIPRFDKLQDIRELVDEGMTALIDVFLKFSKNAKPVFTSTTNTTNHSGYQGGSSNVDDRTRTESAQHAYGKQWQQNDKLTVKKEFVLLVHEHLKHGGMIPEVSHEKMAHIIRIVLQNYGSNKGFICSTDWIKGYLVDSLHSMMDMRNYSKSFKKVLNVIFTQYRVQWKTMDAADLYDGLATVLEQGQGKQVNMHEIAGIMNEKFVSFGLTAATRHNWENDTTGHAKYCTALVRLIIAIMENSTQDVLKEIEQQTATPSLIGKIIIPICLQYNLQSGYSNMPMSNKFRPDPTSNWTRLLNYISRACSQASLLKSKSSGFSLSHLTSGPSGQENVDAGEFSETKDGKQTPRSVALLFSLSFVAMKIILVRGSSSFDKLKGSWVQVAYFIKSALVFGQTLKFLRPKSGKSTPLNVSSPTAGLSPGGFGGSGGQSPGIANWTNSIDGRTGFSFGAPISNSTIYDFTTWRFLEFVICYKSPLHLFLKDFITEKLLDMGGSNSMHRPSMYSPMTSPGVSMNFGSPRPSGGSTRWKSWGGDNTSRPTSQINVIPQVNVQDTDAFPSNDTCGLGLHIPGKSSNNLTPSPRIPPAPSSPSLSSNLHSEFSDSNIPAVSLQSPKNSPKLGKGSRPTSSIYVAPTQGLFTSGANGSTSTVLHILHAESITSIVNVQISMGFKPALPWMASNSRQQLKPWNNREAASKLSTEWQLLLQLYTEVDTSATTKPQTQTNISNSNAPTTPLM